jgi:hypothetical protein
MPCQISPAKMPAIQHKNIFTKMNSNFHNGNQRSTITGFILQVSEKIRNMKRETETGLNKYSIHSNNLHALFPTTWNLADRLFAGAALSLAPFVVLEALILILEVNNFVSLVFVDFPVLIGCFDLLEGG